MPEAVYPLLLLACPLGMMLMMWWMMRGSHAGRGQNTAPGTTPATQAEIDQLRAELRLMRAQQAEHVRESSGN
ncbi:hypothetical protein ABZ214_39260 [Streptomyces iakyrus]|uniref:hypothetical protein n=1 Tax=Streptomyces iakyrus TaxID=68219 RepID=UPI0033B4102D